MKTYIVMPEGCSWYTVKAESPNSAFYSQSCFFKIGRKVAIMDEEQERCWIYTVE